MERLTRKDANGNWYVGDDLCYDSWAVPKKFYGDAIDRLAHYEDLEEQGRLMELPVAVGDEVFVKHWRGHIVSAKISMLQQKADKSWKFRVSQDASVYDCKISELGKTVFLTRAEAEAALAASDVKGE